MRIRVSSPKHLVVLLLSVCAVTAAVAADPQPGSDIRAEFDRHYDAWYIARGERTSQNPHASPFPLLLEEKAIVDMGVPALPFLMEKLLAMHFRSDTNYRLAADLTSLVGRITYKTFRGSEVAGVRYLDHPGVQADLYLDSWTKGRADSPRKFAELYARWDKMTKAGLTDAAKVSLDGIFYMGIEALPFVMDKIRNGDDRLVPFVSKLMRKQIGGENPTRQSVLDWWEANKAKLTLPPLPAFQRPRKPS